jgi:hypothetical protein
MSFRDYINAKQATLKKALENISSGGTGEDEGRVWEPYLRSDFTGWQNSDAYKMSKCDEGYTITLSQNDNFRFKIYDNRSGSWYGSEVVAEGCEVEFGTDGHTNILLSAGTYKIIFVTENQTIIIIPVK